MGRSFLEQKRASLRSVLEILFEQSRVFSPFSKEVLLFNEYLSCYNGVGIRNLYFSVYFYNSIWFMFPVDIAIWKVQDNNPRFW